MKLIVMGTGPFAVPACRRLLAAGHEVRLCVTRPSPPSKGKKMPPRPVWQWAREAGIEVFEPPSINAPEAIDVLRGHDADLLFVCDYGQILSRECLAAARLGGINLHGSLLPRHRGAAPVQWTILRGDQQAGVSVIHMTPRLDAGPVLVKMGTAVDEAETAEELEERLADMGAEATLEAIRLLAKWDGTRPLGEPQDPALVTRAPRFHKSHGQLDFRLPAQYLARLVNALQPWPGTFAELELSSGKSLRIILRRAQAATESLAELANQKQSTERSAAHPEPEPAGAVRLLLPRELGWKEATRWDSALAVATGQGTLLALEIQPAGKRRMTAAEFARGYALDEARFRLPETPCELLVRDE